MASRQVVVTGLGAVSPIGLTIEESWRAACAGRGGIGPITGWDASTFPTQFGAEVKGFSVEPFVRRRETRRLLSRAAGFGLAAARMAWEDAGLGDAVDRSRVGVVLGGCLTAPTLPEVDAWCRLADEGGGPEQAVEDPFGFLRRAAYVGTTLIASELGAEGPNETVYVACASGTQAIGLAWQAIQRGEMEVALTGGYDSMLSEWFLLLFSAINALSRRNGDPEHASRPFDKDRDGFVMGEGAGLLVLEEAEHARRRGATVYAEVLGYGSSLDAYRITDSPPDGRGAVAAMAGALASAGIGPEEVDYINAHGTSTMDNDISETRAVKTVFGEHARRVAISSTKSVTGHLISAAGGLEAAFATLALRDGVIPPTVNLETPDPECDLDYVPGTARRAALRTALSNSFGFGGSNGSIVLRRAGGSEARPPVVSL